MRMRTVGHLSFAASFFLTLASCGKNSNKGDFIVSQPSLESAQARKRASQLALVLRGGRPLSPAELNKLNIEKSPEKFVDELLRKPEFGDSVLGFIRFYVGLPEVPLRSPSGLMNGEQLVNLDSFYSSKNIPVTVARNILNSKDFLDALFQSETEAFAPAVPAFSPDLVDPSGSPANPGGAKAPQTRESILKGLIDLADATIDQMKNNPEFNYRADFCNKTDVVGDFFGAIDKLQISYEFLNLFNNSRLIGYPTYQYCLDVDGPENPAPALPDLLAFKQALLDLLPDLKEVSEPFYSVRSVLDFKPYAFFVNKYADTRPLTDLGSTSQKNKYFWLELQNSSTNKSRKRAAYVLKQFFCEDLGAVPVNIPASVSNDKHASDPNCQSCHYKLDPMAGFFKNLDARGYLDVDRKTMSFSDGVESDYAEYESNWLAEAGSPRTWNIGYIRDLKNPERNSYGETLDDLYSVLKSAPEVRKCLVRKAFAYFVSSKQAIDEKFLDELTKNFNKVTAEKNSGLAFKALVKSLVLSKSFAETNPKASALYDSTYAK